MDKINNNAQQCLSATAKYPYCANVYAARLLWKLVYWTFWKLAVHKFPSLRTRILKLFGAKISGRIMLRSDAWVEMPWGFSAGDACAISNRVRVYNLGNVTIGENTVISHDVDLCGGTHDYTKLNLPLLRKDIHIGSGVWICAGAFIGPGVSIGDGAIVGARAVVTKDVQPMDIVAGNPANVVGRRTIQ